MAESFVLAGPKFQWITSAGAPAAGYKLYTYEVGTVVDKSSWEDDEKATLNANPIILDANGAADVWLDGDYRLILHDDEDNEIWDIAKYESNPSEEWQGSTAATYVSTTVFTVTGDKTAQFEVGRPVRVTSSGPTYAYGVVDTVVYTSLTTVTLTTAVVPAGITDAETSIVGPNSVPQDPDLANYVLKAGSTITGAITVSGFTPSGAQLAMFSQIPTLTSELTNDDGFLTASDLSIPVMNDANGNLTALSGSTTEIAAVSMTLPGGATWKYVKVSFSTLLRSSSSIVVDSIRVDGTIQTLVAQNISSVTCANSDDSVLYKIDAYFVPSDPSINLDIEVYATGSADETSNRRVYAIGHI